MADLKAIIEKAKKGLADRVKAGQDAAGLWAGFWQHLKDEGVEVGDIEAAYTNAVNTAVREMDAAKAAETPPAPPTTAGPPAAPPTSQQTQGNQQGNQQQHKSQTKKTEEPLNWVNVDLTYVSEHYGKHSGVRGIVIQYDSGPNQFNAYFQPEHVHHFPRHLWSRFKKKLIAAGAVDPGDTINGILSSWNFWPNCLRIGFVYDDEGFISIKDWEFEELTAQQRADLQANHHRQQSQQRPQTVSYTHLTLPTICSV